ncbi:uncharacterized protein LOC105354977 [Oryzias latipes]|uniref:uncharacterized protein LOC105354977 n=1 Tax=Oryzias latipes TaxID=8090 RepID=UPI0005CC74FC|nr:uncharacterized protein LOC105354977 [Oryzias latipes]
MLAEGFLTSLPFREEKRFASKQKRGQTSAHGVNPLTCAASCSRSALPQMLSAEAGPNLEDLSSAQRRRVPPQPPGLFIPGYSPAPTPNLVCIENCSLLDQYPDLQVADSGRISHNPVRANSSQQDSGYPAVNFKPEVYAGSAVSIPDQGYLVMGGTQSISLDANEPGLEPMSNSVLNGLLEKKLEEVYMQHLTDNLARCNSHLENSLLHGLVPPPQPGSQEPYSLENSMDQGPQRGSGDKISYLSTQNVAPSSHFSSPVLRISEAENPHLQANVLLKY